MKKLNHKFKMRNFNLASYLQYALLLHRNVKFKKIKMFALNLLLLLLFCVRMSAQEICGTIFEKERLIEMYPELDSVYRSQDQVLEYISFSNRSIVTIPVVFHVICNTPSQQVPVAWFQQAIDILT